MRPRCREWSEMMESDNYETVLTIFLRGITTKKDMRVFVYTQKKLLVCKLRKRMQIADYAFGRLILLESVHSTNNKLIRKKAKR